MTIDKKDAEKQPLKESSIIASKNVQRYAFQLTINNPQDYGFNHKEIKKRLIENFSTLKYFCMADEISESGTPHTHIYVCFGSRVRWSTIKKHFSSAHIEIAHGTILQNLEYVKKTGRWEYTEKSETKVDGTFEEWGTIPKQKGQKAELEELYQLIADGYSNADILAINNDYIMYIDKLDKIRTMLLTEKYKNTRRLDMTVTYVFGATATGKTKGVLDEYGDANVYRVTDYQHPFDGYNNCQPVLVFDEFRSQLRISDMLEYCDIYPIELPARYANKFACYNAVYIISNWALEEQYKDIQTNSPETWQAFLRRIKKVKCYHKDGRIDTYDSVDAYLNRWQQPDEGSQFQQMEIPFDDNCAH